MKESAAESVFSEVTHPDTTAGVSEPKVIASEATDIATPPASKTIEDIKGQLAVSVLLSLVTFKPELSF
jgi:hypothetical protein